MFELPEAVVLTRQMNEHLCGKVIEDGSLGNSPHKFAWYNRSEAEFRSLIKGKKIGKAWTKGRWMIIEVGSAHHLVFGETGASRPMRPKPLMPTLMVMPFPPVERRRTASDPLTAARPTPFADRDGSDKNAPLRAVASCQGTQRSVAGLRPPVPHHRYAGSPRWRHAGVPSCPPAPPAGRLRCGASWRGAGC